jgi:hypothetical protein
MKHEIIETENYLLVVDDSEIKEGDYHVAIRIVKTNGDKAIAFTDQEQLDAIAEIGGAKKIIAHLPLNNSPILQGVDLLPPLEQEDDVEKLADEHSNFERKSKWGDIVRNAYRAGYNKAKEKYKYTEEDMIKGMRLYAAWISGGTPSLRVAKTAEERHKQVIQSLSQPKIPIGFECEMETYEPNPNSDRQYWLRKPKTTTNSQGQTQWVGKYIY